VRLSGGVSDDVTVFNGRLTISSAATVGGDVTSRRDPVIAQGATISGDVQGIDGASINRSLDVAGNIARFGVWLAISFSTLVLGLLMLLLAPRAAEGELNAMRNRLGPAIGIGLAAFIGLPILAIIALVTIVGIPLGVGLLLALVPLWAIGYATSAWLLGRTLVRAPNSRMLAYLAGWGILRVVALVPVLGGLAWFAAVVLGLGAIAVNSWQARAAAAPPVPAPST
jgi:hypothetical protein